MHWPTSSVIPGEAPERETHPRVRPPVSSTATPPAKAIAPHAPRTRCTRRGGLIGVAVHSRTVTGTLIGYARCSRGRDDLIAQRKALRALGVENAHIHVDRGLAGTPPRPGLDRALSATQRGDTLVVASLSRLVRSLRDARAIGDRLAAAGVRLSLGGEVYDPARAGGRHFFSLLATFAELEVDLVRLRTREGMAVARANGRLRGKQPKLNASQHAQLLALHTAGGHTISELAGRLGVSRATIYRALDRARAGAAS